MMSQKFTISPEVQREIELNEILKSQEKAKTIVEADEEICLMCSS
jgi:hypothetical protein